MKITIINVLKIIILALALIVGFLIFKLTNDRALQVQTPDELIQLQNQTRTWRVYEVKPNMDNSALLSVTLKSKLGNIRTYENIFSYGLSILGKYLAIRDTKGIELINLNDNTSTLITPPLPAFDGDKGDVIKWNYDDSYFAFSILNKGSPFDTRVWVYDLKGILVKEIQNTITFRPNPLVVESVEFSQTSNNYLAVRTYKKEEMTSSDASTLYNLPAYITIYNLNGEVIKEIMAKDAAQKPGYIYFQFDKSQELIDYLVSSDPITQIPLDYQFTKVSYVK
jgi:hypothetical protein